MPTAGTLKHFTKEQILIDRQQARTILIFFFGNDVPAVTDITDQDVEFAQALILEAIDKSYAKGYVQAVFDAFYMKIPTDFTSPVKDFAKKAAKKIGSTTPQVQIFQTLRSTTVWHNKLPLIGECIRSGECECEAWV